MNRAFVRSGGKGSREGGGVGSFERNEPSTVLESAPPLARYNPLSYPSLSPTDAGHALAREAPVWDTPRTSEPGDRAWSSGGTGGCAWSCASSLLSLSLLLVNRDSISHEFGEERRGKGERGGGGGQREREKKKKEEAERTEGWNETRLTGEQAERVLGLAAERGAGERKGQQTVSWRRE